MPTQSHVISDLIAAGEDVDRLVADLEPDLWATPTPAEGWTVAHQIAHLAATFRMAATAAADPESFKAFMAKLGDDFGANVRTALSPFLAAPPAALLAAWRAERAAVEKALAAVPDGQVVPWLVRPIPAPVLAAAGMMELFGHGQDIADALGVERERTDRIRSIVEFAVRVWDFGYQARGLAVPEVEFGFELTSPSGREWRYGPADATQKVTGPAYDLCLLVTRRRHREDLGLSAVGPDADRWLDIAQAYRGPAGSGRKPGQFAGAGTAA